MKQPPLIDGCEQPPPDPIGFAVAYLRQGGFRDDGFPIAGMLALRDDAAEARAECAMVMAERDRLREALREIRTGKTHADNEHPLGEHFSMACRFHNIATAALAARAGGGE